MSAHPAGWFGNENTYEHRSSQSDQRVSLQAQVTQSIQIDEGAILYGTQAIIIQSQGF